MLSTFRRVLKKITVFPQLNPPSVKTPNCPFIFTCCSVPLAEKKAELYPPPPQLPQKLFPPALCQRFIDLSMEFILD